MPKGNPNPTQTPEFRSYCKQPIGEMPSEPLARKPVSVKVGLSVAAKIEALTQAERITWLRRVITEAAERELKPSAGGDDQVPG